jgi:phosphoribosyl-AMP cyclohydrolase
MAAENQTMFYDKKHKFVVVFLFLGFIVVITLLMLVWMHRNARSRSAPFEKHVLYFHLCTSQDTLYIMGKRSGPFYQAPLAIVSTRERDTVVKIVPDQIVFPNQPPIPVDPNVRFFLFDVEREASGKQYWLTIKGYDASHQPAAEPLSLLRQCSE